MRTDYVLYIRCWACAHVWSVLMEAVRRGGDLDLLARLVGRLQALQTRRQAFRAARQAGGAITRQAAPDALERRLRARLADWRGLLTRNVESGREVLKALLVEPLRFEPVIDGCRRAYRFRGTIALDRLVAGVIDLESTDQWYVPSGIRDLWNAQDPDNSGRVAIGFDRLYRRVHLRAGAASLQRLHRPDHELDQCRSLTATPGIHTGRRCARGGH